MVDLHCSPALSNSTAHGVMLSCYGLGVLITGLSGCGKSRLAWQLLQRGHVLVCDDVPLLTRSQSGQVQATCDPLLQGLLHVRGLGVLDIARLFGQYAVRSSQRLDVVLHLTTETITHSHPPLTPPRQRRVLLGVELPELRLDPKTPRLVESADTLLRAEIAQFSVSSGQTILQQRLRLALQNDPHAAEPALCA